MNQVLTKNPPPTDLFGMELNRVVSDFVENATDEDVDRLLERASNGFDSRINTPSVIVPIEAAP